MDTITESITHCIEYASTIRSPHTAVAYQNGIEHLRDYLISLKIDVDHEPVSSIKMAHFSQLPAQLSTRGYSKKTIGVYLSGVQFYLDYLITHEMIEPTFAEGARQKESYKIARSKREYKLTRWPQRGAVDKILEAAKTMQWSDNHGLNELLRLRNRAIVEFLASTGCRNNEAAQLKIKNLDMTDRSAIVVGKCSKERRVFFSQETAEVLESYWDCRGFRGANSPIFSPHSRNTNQNKHLTTKTIRKVVDSLVMAAGLEKGTFTPHYFRHAFAINVLGKTSNLALVQDLLGHSDPAATRVYAKIYPEDLHKAHRDIYG